MVKIKKSVRSFILPLALLTFALLPFFRKAEEPRVSAFFSSEWDCSKEIIKRIDGAKGEIAFSIYIFSDETICKSLLNAVERGVRVRGVVDKSTIRKKSHIVQKLQKGGVELKTIKKEKGIVHHKFIVVDSKIVITGSYNWTFFAKTFNYENIVVIESEKIAQKYLKEYDRILWGIYGDY